jgi:glutamyl-tRNA synthetase
MDRRPDPVITRLAPTPSGFLHAGNAVNFQLVAWLAEKATGEVVLRIDDIDAPRYRAAYVDDVLHVLDWLGIAWHRGPRTVAGFETTYSMRRRTDYYREQLDLLAGSALEVYACTCSRTQLQGAVPGECPGGCRARGLALVTGESALRVHVPPRLTVDVAGRPISVAERMGDFVVWRRDGTPAYHLASVIEDRDLGVTHIVRGEDLVDSTAAQVLLASAIGASSVAGAVYVHHPLITDPSGAKLSKSRLSAGPMARSVALRDEVRRMAARIGAPLGIGPPA